MIRHVMTALITFVLVLGVAGCGKKGNLADVAARYSAYS